MTEADWLSRRTPSPPEELASAIRSALDARRSPNKEDPSPTELLQAAQLLLERVLANECAQRESALDLLTADALVTYALEIANEKGSLSAFPELAMEKLAGSK
jgi:hypothetical protein